MKNISTHLKIWTILVTGFLCLGELSAQQQPFVERLEHNGQNRRFIVYLPVGYTPDKPRPLFINMHGFTSTMSQQMTLSGFNATADLKDCIVVYPDGIQNRWNSGTNFGVVSKVDDVGFLSKLIDRIILLYNADPSMVYSTGFSAGGFMSYRLACELTNRVSAIAPVVGSMVEDTYASCAPARPISVIAFNGTDDAVTNYDGFPGNIKSIPEVINSWVNRNNCIAEAEEIQIPNTVSNDNSTVTKFRYTGCDEETEVVLMRINKGGHTWPGSIIVGLGNTNQDIKANDEIYDFCTKFKIPAAVFCDAPTGLTATLVEGSSSSYQLNWNPVDGIKFYTLALVDVEKNITILDTLVEVGATIEVSDIAGVQWSVRSECESGHANWARPQTFSVSTSVKSSLSNSLKLYPNPANGFIYINTGEYSKQTPLSIHDVTGKIVTSGFVAPGVNERISLDKLSAGVYVLRVGEKSGTFIKLP